MMGLRRIVMLLRESRACGMSCEHGVCTCAITVLRASERGVWERDMNERLHRGMAETDRMLAPCEAR